MIGRTMLLTIALAAAVGAGLYHLKHEVMVLEQELAKTNRAILGDQQAVHVLQAEWTYLNEPRRLEALSRRFLELAPLAAAQVITLNDLPTRLDSVITDANNPPAAGGATPAVAGVPR
jgi:hypothetical protein